MSFLLFGRQIFDWLLYIVPTAVAGVFILIWIRFGFKDIRDRIIMASKEVLALLRRNEKYDSKGAEKRFAAMQKQIE
jgi:hypothetical protein